MALSGIKYTGQNLSVSLAGAVLEQELVKSCTIAESKDVHDSTGGGGGAKTFLGGETTATFSLEIWDSTKLADAITKIDLTDDDGVAVIVYPNGNTSGMQKRSFSVVWTGLTQGVEKNGVVPLSISGQISGAITDALVT